MQSNRLAKSAALEAAAPGGNARRKEFRILWIMPLKRPTDVAMFMFDYTFPQGKRRFATRFNFSMSEIEDLAKAVCAWRASEEAQAHAVPDELRRMETLSTKLIKLTEWMSLGGFPNAQLKFWRPVQ